MSCQLFHVTTSASAEAILREGFRDGQGSYFTDQVFSGVWVSDRPLDANEGAWGDVILSVNFSVSLSELAQYEWVEDGKTYREWLIPAAVIQQLAVVTRFEEEQS